jgi:hypothetical protein
MGVNDDNDDFWDDLLGHIQDRALVPVVGPELTVVKVGDAEQTFSSLIGQRLVERYGLDEPEIATMGEAVAAILRSCGRDELQRLYGRINNIIRTLDPAPGDALRDLAAISDLRTFVSTTPDRLLARAVNEVRFHGRPDTREVVFSPSMCTPEQDRNEQAALATDTVVLNLFGRASSSPQYAIHEEDRLEWLHALLSGTEIQPDWLAQQLKQQPMLFIGCEIPDWIGRFLLRMSSNSRLALESKQFFFVGPPNEQVESLSDFFKTYCPKPLVQHLPMEPGAFVAELRARWEEQSPARAPEVADPAGHAASDEGTIFISYIREDADAAQRLCKAIEGLGGDVWLDRRRLSAGAAWEREIQTAIRRTIKLFVPVVSANTERAEEGYVFREWREAVDRSRAIPRRRFIVPVVIDEDYEGDPSRYRQVDDLEAFQFGYAPAGDPDADLSATLTAQIRDMRRPDAT